MPLESIDSIEAYLARFGAELAARVSAEHPPLIDPRTDPVHPRIAELLRRPYAAQAHVITALARGFARGRGLVLVGEQGSGKTLIAAGLLHVMFPGPFRVLVLAPGIAIRKWKRECERTIPGVRVTYLRSYKACVEFERAAPAAPTGREVYLLARDRAKLSYRRTACYLTSERRPLVALCPDCGAPQEVPRTGEGGTVRMVPIARADLDRARSRCVRCQTPLWTVDPAGPRRVAPADYIGRRLKGRWSLLVADEAHELKAADSLQGHALGRLAQAARHTLLLTGTLTGGQSSHVQHLLGRIAMDLLVAEGMGVKDRHRWVAAYGVSERIETTLPNGQTRRARHERAGVSPRIFSRYLQSCTAFLNLSDLAANLPPYQEEVRLVDMDPELAAAYTQLRDAIRLGMTSERRIYRGRLGAFVTTLLTYLDHPAGWAPIHHPLRPQQIIATPASLPLDVEYAKDRALIELVREEAAQRRGVVVYVTNTGAHDVSARVTRLLRRAGISTRELRAEVANEDREAWLEKADADGVEAVVANATLISVSLDIARPTLVWYQLPLSLYTLRQASRRAWRLTQTQPCRTLVLSYRDSIQTRLLAVIGQKLAAALTVEGRLDEEGLRALATEEDITTQLARSVLDGLGEVASVETVWREIAERERALGLQAAPEAMAARLAIAPPVAVATDESPSPLVTALGVDAADGDDAPPVVTTTPAIEEGPLCAPASGARRAAPDTRQLGFSFAQSA